MEQSRKKMRVLYIAGDQRSGSTILQNVLGQLEGFCAAGELRNTWRALSTGQPICGCGRPAAECEFWRGVVSAAFPEPRDLAGYRELHRQSLWFRRRLLIRRFLPFYDPRRNAKWPGFRDVAVQLLRAIEGVTGCHTIIDSSKAPAYGCMLDHLPGVEVFVLHLVRDPRGAQYSLLKRQELGHRKLRSYNPFFGSLGWLFRNSLTRLVFGGKGTRYLLVRYEDFASEPRPTLERVLKWLGEETSSTVISDSNELDLPWIHALGGSPHRFKTGKTVIRPDMEWRKKLKVHQRAQIALGAGVGLLLYGYWPEER
jgi:hypothetical protein